MTNYPLEIEAFFANCHPTTSAQFSGEISEFKEGAYGGENVLISSSEIVLMQTAKSEVKNPTKSNTV